MTEGDDDKVTREKEYVSDGLRCSCCRKKIPTKEERDLVSQKASREIPAELCRCEHHWHGRNVDADTPDQQTIV